MYRVAFVPLSKYKMALCKQNVQPFQVEFMKNPFQHWRNEWKTRLIYINKHILAGVIANFYSLDSWNIEFTFAFAFAFGVHKNFDWYFYTKGTSKCCHHLLHLPRYACVFVPSFKFAVLLKLLPRNFSLSLDFNGAFFVHNNRFHFQTFSSLWFPFACRFPRIYCNAMLQLKI